VQKGVEKISFDALIKINKGFETLFDGSHSPKYSEILEGEKDYALIITFNSLKSLFSYIYTSQIANSVSLIIDRKKDINKLIIPQQLKSLLPKDGTFRITTKIGYEREIGELFKEYKVDLKNPDFNIEIQEFNSEFFLSLDLSGDLSKRDYKVFNNPLSLKGTTAFGALMLSGYKKGKSLLDPYCNSGTIGIEAVLYNNNISPRFYNKNFPFTKLFVNIDIESFFGDMDAKAKYDMLSITVADPLLRNITAARRNAKVAGVEKCMRFRRIDIDWMDIKHNEKQFDYILTFIPGSSKHKSLASLKKEFEELFYQTEYIIKKEGIVSILCLSKDLLIDSASKYFVLKELKTFYSGTQLMYLLLFEKRTAKDKAKTD